MTASEPSLQQAARERLARLEVIALLDDLDSRYGSPSAADGYTVVDGLVASSTRSQP
jgi:hypothetical protein